MQRTLTAKQCKAARAMLSWTIDDLADNAGVARSVILRLEREETNIRQTSLDAIYKTFSKANIDFLMNNGVAEKSDSVDLLQGARAVERLWENIIYTFSETGGEVLVLNVDEEKALKESDGKILNHLMNLERNNIKERILSCEGDNNFIASKDCYRWLPREVFDAGVFTYVYKGKVAYQLIESQLIILIHSNDAYNAEKKRFEYLWQNAKIPD